jgi:4a-hydroxytetrahydrobiopterin dehydratase
VSLRDPLTPAQVAARLQTLRGWAGDTHQIRKTFSVGYDTGIKIVTEIGKAAIELEHRPDIDIRWDNLVVTMTTHTAGDVVTELDFKLAQRIDEIAELHGATSQP